MTNEPASRLATLLAPLRPIADEVVIAADARVETATLAGYAALADRLFTVDFLLYERHLPWLHAQCMGDWILRFDGDELPSAALVRRLPELLERRDVHQYWIRRAWVYPDAATVLDELPWSTDYLNRLVRNDGTLSFIGIQHAHANPVSPSAYIEQPVYHLELLLADVASRRSKAIRYEVSRPNLRPPGGGRFNEAYYVPELRTRLRTAAVPMEDAAALTAVAHLQPPAVGGSSGAVEHITLARMDALWSGRTLGATAYRASVCCQEEEIELVAGETRVVFVQVINEGDELWPGGMQMHPLIRLSYRWLRRDGSVHTHDGPRSQLPASLAPGATALVPLQVLAPSQPDRLVLEIDLVHEDVRWFCSGERVRAQVRKPDRDARPLRETRSKARRGRGKLLIPGVVHRIWLGDAPLPPEMEAMGATFAEHHAGWEMRLWGDDDLGRLGISAADRARARTPSELSNLMRYEILRREGGVYVDTDVECRRELTPLLNGVTAGAALELPGRLGTAVLAAVAGHRVFERAAREARHTLGLGNSSSDANGPYFLTLIVEQENDFTIFESGVFYPYLWDEPERAQDSFPDAYLVHHWARSWWEGAGPRGMP